MALVTLLHFDGLDNQTYFPDTSFLSKTWVSYGAVFLKTAQKKFGTASLYTAALAPISLAYDSNLVFGANSFTIDCWINLSNTAGANRIIGFGADTAAYANIFFGIGTVWGGGVKLNFGYRNATNTGYVDITSSAVTISVGEWHHVAAIRNGTAFNMYFDGVSVGSATMSSSVIFANTGNPHLIGARWNTVGSALEVYNGYIDEFRILNGEAAWTGNFTPPTAPYENPSIVRNSFILNYRGI